MRPSGELDNGWRSLLQSDQVSTELQSIPAQVRHHPHHPHPHHHPQRDRPWEQQGGPLHPQPQHVALQEDGG